MRQKVKLGLLSLLSLALFSCTEREVVPVAVQSVSLNKATTALSKGETETLSAVVAPADATNQNIVWSTNDEAVATVSEVGLVTAVKEGTATITVTTKEGGKTATCVVTVSKNVVAVQSVSLNKATTALSKGETETLSAVVVPADATNQNIVWSTNDEAVATVSPAGVVTALQEGTATITVTTQEGNKTATCVVTVTVNYVVINGLKWTKGSLVANGANGCKVGAPTDYGLYFHFGSLVGWTGGVNGDGTGTGQPALAVKVNPAGYTGSTSWPAGSFTGGTAGKGYGLPATDAPTTGIGDPCRYYLGGTWRTPTAEEYKALFGGANNGAAWGSVPGWSWQASPVGPIGPSSLFFPLSGYRNKNANGGFITVGSNGDYWSSSVNTTTMGYYLYFSNSVVYPQNDIERLNGFPVRCVSE